jgi:hypothetical protein
MTSTPTEKLRDCPFCGGEANFGTPRGDFWHVECSNFECAGCGKPYSSWTKDRAIELWNTRATVATLTDASLVEKLAGALEESNSALAAAHNQLYYCDMKGGLSRQQVRRAMEKNQPILSAYREAMGNGGEG